MPSGGARAPGGPVSGGLREDLPRAGPSVARQSGSDARPGWNADPLIDTGSGGGVTPRIVAPRSFAGHADAGHVLMQDETRMMTAATPLGRARSRAQGVLGQLKRLLIGRVGPEFDATSYEQASPALAAAIAVRVDSAASYGSTGTMLDDYSSAGVARVAGRLREQTTELKKKAETKGEKATIEIVALMFQAILQEDRIPPGIRVWFARLQMPVLRVALAEPDFFGTARNLPLRYKAPPPTDDTVTFSPFFRMNSLRSKPLFRKKR